MKINLRTLIINICCIVLLFYPFNSTIIRKIYPSNSLVYIFAFLALLILLILGKVKKIKKYQMIILIVTILLGTFEVISNKYQYKTKMVIFTTYLFVPLVMSFNGDSITGFKKGIKLFAFEHIAVTYFAAIFSNLYANSLLKFLESIPGSLARSHFNSGFNPGLTLHYSTNGMYLAIFAIYFFVNFSKKKTKKNLILFVLSFIALMVVGKRGVLIFSILAFIITYFLINKDRISKKLFNFTFIVISAILMVYIISSFIPSVTIVFDRFAKAIDSGSDLMTGRNEFYDLAISIWKDNPILGNGWGSFSNYYQIYLYRVFGVEFLDAHNVYIQLLCETGIIGSTIIIGLMFGILSKTYLLIKKNDNGNDIMLLFSFCYQIFFLLYCFSGNPLYDPQCYVIYFICIGIYLYSNIRRSEM